MKYNLLVIKYNFAKPAYFLNKIFPFFNFFVKFVMSIKYFISIWQC